MNALKINYQSNQGDLLPSFSLTVEQASAVAVHSSQEVQNELVRALRAIENIIVHDRQDGLYERLSVGENITFFHKWFNCQIPLSEILVMFHLHHCSKKVLKNCSMSEIRRTYFAKQFMTSVNPTVYLEPIYGVDVQTIDVFMKMIQSLKENNIPVLILTTNLEHALLLSETTYKLKNTGLQEVETTKEVTDELEVIDKTKSPTVTHLFKLSAKIEDKVILFDPLEIDYIESYDGKSQLVINDESFTMDSTLADVEKKLTTYGFFRCHRSYIVNLQKVREIITWSKNTYSLKIDNQIESTIPLSRTKIKEIEEIFNLK